MRQRLLLACAGIAWLLPCAAPAAPRETPKPAQPSALRNPLALAAAIDREIDGRLLRAKLHPSPVSDDAEFLRRVYLDLHGVIPSPEKAVVFLDSKDPDKRAKLIDELLTDSRYGQNMADMWTSILYRVILERRYSPPQEPFTQWLETAFNKNMPWDKQAYEIITASGNVGKNPVVAPFIHTKGVRSIEEVTNLTGRVFLGRADIKCAQCHDHPFLPLKRAEYWGVAAFFSRLEVVRDNTSKGLKNSNLGLGDRLDSPTPRKEVDLPDGYKVVPPRFLEGEEPKLDNTIPYRQVFGTWVASPKNPFFARAAVNRTWAHLFGKGIVNPIDEMNEKNAPTHPELLTLLSDHFVANGFDLKYLIRAICNSQTYQRSSRTTAENAGDEKWYSHMPVKVLSPRQLFDSMSQMTSLTGDARKGRDSFIASFGLPESTDGELPDVSEYNRNLVQQLRMMTGNPPFQTLPMTLLKKLSPGDRSPKPVIEQLYLTILSRRPNPREVDRATTFVEGRGEAGYTELARVLLTTSEFALNH
jgi:hypothetical protein